MFEIEKGVSIPPMNKGRDTLYPVLDEMEVGDCVDVPRGKEGSFHGAVMHRQVRYGKKFTQRKQDDGSVRVWRVA